MEILGFIVGFIVVIIACVLIAASRRPKEFRVERSTATTASAASVYRIISDFNRFAEWSPWQDKDPNMSTEINGEPGTVGTTYSWEGNKDVGAGRMTITAAELNERIDLKLEFLKPFKATNQATWRVDEEDGQRRIHWIMDGRNDTLMQQVMSMFFNMDKMVGPDFEKGLASLRQVAENQAA